MANTTKKHPGGRPSKFPTIDKNKMKFLVEKGFTDKEISDFFDINESTLNAWKKQFPDFSKSLKDWKDEADKKVEQALYKRAIGYEHDSEDIFCFNGKAIRVPIKKKYAPSEVACIFWLKNRHPDRWRDKPAESPDEEIKERELEFVGMPKGEVNGRYKRFYN